MDIFQRIIGLFLATIILVAAVMTGWLGTLIISSSQHVVFTAGEVPVTGGFFMLSFYVLLCIVVAIAWVRTVISLIR